LKYRENLGKIQSAKKNIEVERALADIFHSLKSNYGQDFSMYKPSTINRRIERRMIVRQIPDISDYANFILENQEELDLLFRELLIGVTNFFRDEKAFAKFESEVIPFLIKNKHINDTLRVWVPACSTGEEAYSIAIILLEKTKLYKKNLKIQIFATDVDKDAVEKARIGKYPDNIIADIDSDLLVRYFDQVDNIYEIKKKVRDKVVFAVQNVIRDPPFSKIDLISCRNLLIYLTAEIQKKLLALFHYALNPDGILFLGSSESLGSMSDIFDPIDRKYKIFKKKEIPSYKMDEISIFPPLFDRFKVKRFETGRAVVKLGLEELMHTELLNAFSPPSVIVDDKNRILYFHGQTNKFFSPPEGFAKMDLISMAKHPLKVELSTSIRKARLKKEDVKVKNIQINENGDNVNIDLIIHPILEPRSMRDLMMIVFKEVPLELKEQDFLTSKTGEDLSDSRIKYLEEELESTKKHLQSTIEELETSNEELKSTNEELQSSNEELQSTNEELQTSKEELQSINEELIAVNTELEEKIQELSKANNDLSNLMKNSKIAFVFLNPDLTIKRFTPEFSKIFNVIESDLGRPISHIVSNLKYATLTEDIREILQNLGILEKEVQTIDENWYKMKISPYLTDDKKIEGVVLTFSEITMQKKATEEIEFYRDLLVHEINNIFQVFSSSIEMIKDRIDTNEEIDHCFTIISKNITRGRKLIKNVQKIEEMSDTPVYLELINFLPILNDVKNHITEIEEKDSQAEIKIENLLDSDTIFIEGDALMSDLLENIILNSIRHNDNPLAEISIKLSGITKNNTDYLKLEFIDNGIGIPDQLKENVFQRLYYKRKKGIGIGLSVVKRIVERYEGDIWVEDRVEGDHKQGSKFIVLLPMSS
jgi:two-component system CheB/CheR fusion protein